MEKLKRLSDPFKQTGGYTSTLLELMSSWAIIRAVLGTFEHFPEYTRSSRGLMSKLMKIRALPEYL
ncbi:hypothetical protein [Sporosarcina cyprini]|uniref:hypothetical protein n=1 Tax=Sporosarcina cyprini TaxID=2910523 RepID=UPI001EDE4D05|nr:hypothetical protein [Sporosarcina cyprini]MCG3087299.1 hypothetical protein [Sporosarcina cyprini]